MLRSIVVTRAILFLGIISIYSRAADNRNQPVLGSRQHLSVTNAKSALPNNTMRNMKRANVDSFYAKSYRGDNVCTWVGPSTGNWEDAASWSCGHVPTSDNDVEIYTASVTINSVAIVNSVIVGPGAGLIVASNKSLFVLH